MKLQSLANVDAARLVVLSPHADDAAWSLGGLLNVLGMHARIVTIFDGDPPHAPTCGSATAVDTAGRQVLKV